MLERYSHHEHEAPGTRHLSYYYHRITDYDLPEERYFALETLVAQEFAVSPEEADLYLASERISEYMLVLHKDYEEKRVDEDNLHRMETEYFRLAPLRRLWREKRELSVLGGEIDEAKQWLDMASNAALSNADIHVLPTCKVNRTSCGLSRLCPVGDVIKNLARPAFERLPGGIILDPIRDRELMAYQAEILRRNGLILQPDIEKLMYRYDKLRAPQG